MLVCVGQREPIGKAVRKHVLNVTPQSTVRCVSVSVTMTTNNAVVQVRAHSQVTCTPYKTAALIRPDCCDQVELLFLAKDTRSNINLTQYTTCHGLVLDLHGLLF